MELQQLRYVVAVAETRHFTRAAQQCFVVQSALSHQVARLEQEVGAPLFTRTSRRVDLTPAGEAFLPWARSCLAAAERAAAEATAAAGILTGTLRIGLIPTVNSLDVPALVRRFRDQHPDVDVTLRVGGSLVLAEAVHDGQMDLALLGLSEDVRPRGVAYRELGRESLVAVVPESHRLARRRRIRLEEIAADDFADFPAGSPGRRQSDRAFQVAGLDRRVPYESTTPEVIGSLVRVGLAVALLPAASAPPGDCRVLTVTGAPQRIEYLAWSAAHATPAARAALAMLDIDPSEGRA